MEAYIQAAEQLKEDLADEYIRSHPHTAREDILKSSPNGKVVFDNIEIVFKNSAKYKLFSQRIQGQKRSILEGDELLYSYLTTSDDESYNDSLESAKCCKKMAYFLFTSRFEKFTLVERNKYSDSLRKHEGRLPSKAIDLYNAKKILIDMMGEGKPTHKEIQPVVIRFVELLNDILESQASIYKVEYKLCELFREYLDTILIPQFSSPGFKVEPVKIKALVQALRELRERGLEFEEFKDSISVKLFESVISVMAEHMECLLAEIRTIADVNYFLLDVIKYSEPTEEIKQEKETVGDAGFMASIRAQITSRVAEWLSS